MALPFYIDSGIVVCLIKVDEILCQILLTGLKYLYKILCIVIGIKNKKLEKGRLKLFYVIVT